MHSMAGCIPSPLSSHSSALAGTVARRAPRPLLRNTAARSLPPMRALPAGGVPPSWAELPGLKRVCLAENALNGTLPKVLPPSVEHLDLRSNKFKGAVATFKQHPGGVGGGGG